MTKTLLLLKSVVLMLSILTFVQACKKTSYGTIEGNYNLRANETINLPKNSANTLTVSDFADSRCPINADCVWQGVATIKVAITENEKTQNLELCKGGCNVTKQATIQEFTINDVAYTIELADMKPYPSTAKTSIKQIAELVIKRK
ncbi:MAG: hypothetical protein EOO87_23540 [Pedobacter sp.]|nr:MAG: hypothetical protein EOO87_23540 [Pedobacter sp.]